MVQSSHSRDSRDSHYSTTFNDLSQMKTNTANLLPQVQSLANSLERNLNAQRNTRVSVREMNSSISPLPNVKLGKLKKGKT